MISMHTVKIRKTHPALYRTLMTFGLLDVALAVNFWTSTPTFNPYGVDKNIIGIIFAVIGISHVLFLNVLHDLRIVRVVLAVSVSWMFFWGASNAEQSLAGKASYQLPLLYVGLSLLQIPLLIESPVNPMTERR